MIFTIREAKLEDIERLAFISITAWQQSYKGIVKQSYLDSISYEDRIKSRKFFFTLLSPKACFVAVVQNKIVGFCDVGIVRSTTFSCKGEVYAIYLLEEFKYQGIGTALWSVAVKYLQTQKLTPFIVQVLKNNILARHFYEKRGGILQEFHKIQIDNDIYEEVTYIFKELITTDLS